MDITEIPQQIHQIYHTHLINFTVYLFPRVKFLWTQLALKIHYHWKFPDLRYFKGFTEQPSGNIVTTTSSGCTRWLSSQELQITCTILTAATSTGYIIIIWPQVCVGVEQPNFTGCFFINISIVIYIIQHKQITWPAYGGIPLVHCNQILHPPFPHSCNSNSNGYITFKCMHAHRPHCSDIHRTCDMCSTVGLPTWTHDHISLPHTIVIDNNNRSTGRASQVIGCYNTSMFLKWTSHR